MCGDLIRAYPRCKKKFIDDWEIIAYWQESDQSEALSKKCGLFQKQLGGAMVELQENFAIFTLI